MKEQINLIYFGHFTWLDTEMMYPYERTELYNMLVEIRKEEQRQIDEANRNRT